MVSKAFVASILLGRRHWETPPRSLSEIDIIGQILRYLNNNHLRQRSSREVHHLFLCEVHVALWLEMADVWILLQHIIVLVLEWKMSKVGCVNLTASEFLDFFINLDPRKLTLGQCDLLVLERKVSDARGERDRCVTR